MLETEQKYEEYVADALKCVQLKFGLFQTFAYQIYNCNVQIFSVGSTEEIESAPGFEPEFAHQHFGES